MSELWTQTASELARMVREKEVSAVEVTQAHLSRIEAVNPSLNAIVQHMPEQALESARETDAKIARGQDPGPLCGVPVTIKVNVDQEGFATTNGLKLQKDLIAASDSPVVNNIKKAGGVIVGRTNTPAFSLRWFSERPPATSRWLQVTAQSRIGPPFGGLVPRFEVSVPDAFSSV